MKKILIFIFVVLSCTSLIYSQLNKYGGELIYGEVQYPENYDPFMSINNMASVRISQLMFETLVTEDEFGDMIPQLAKSWSIINNKTIKFKIRKNVKWHDGFPFTPRDIEFTINALKNPQTRSANYFKTLAGKIEDMELDENSVEFTMTKPVSNLLKFFTKIYIYPEHLFRNNKIDGTVFFSSKPIGTGPFKFKNLDPGGDRIRLVKNPYYYKNVFLDKITASIQRDADVSVQELKFGSTILKVNVPNKDVGPLEATGKFRVYPYSSLKIDVVAMNFNNKLLHNKFIRKAMVYGTDRQKLLDTYYLGKGSLISGPFAPNSTAYNPNVLPSKYDEYMAKLNLTQYGCSDSDNDGILEFDGEPLDFNLLVSVDKANSTAIQLADAIKDQLSRIGIKINVIRQEYHSFIDRVVYKKDFDLALFSIAFDENVNIAPLFYPNGEKNFISYNNREVNQLLDEANQSSDNEKKRTIFYKLHKILAEDAPYIFLWTLQSNAVARKELRGISIDPFKFFIKMDKWYIDPRYR